MERQRRENNKKVMTLFIEMRDMLAVVLQYVPLFYGHCIVSLMPCVNGRVGDIEDKSTRLSEEEVLEGRMQSLMKTIGDEITDSYRTCEAYSKECLVAKVWKSSQWAGKLVEHAQRFVRRRDDIVLALSAHSAHTGDENQKIIEENLMRTKRLEET